MYFHPVLGSNSYLNPYFCQSRFYCVCLTPRPCALNTESRGPLDQKYIFTAYEISRIKTCSLQDRVSEVDEYICFFRNPNSNTSSDRSKKCKLIIFKSIFEL